MQGRPAPSRRFRAHASFQLWLVNVLVGALVGTLWLVRVPGELSAWTRAYVCVALLSGVATLALGPGLLFAVLHWRLRRRWRLAAVGQSFVGTLFLALLATDTNVHGQLGYHFNGAVLNMALNPASGEAVNLGWTVWTTAVGGISLGTGLQYLLWRMSIGWLERRAEAGRDVPWWAHPRVVCLAFLLPAFGIEKSVYAAAHVQGDLELLTASRRLPIYPRVELGRLLDPEGRRLPELDLAPEEATLDYPRSPVVLPEDGARPNLFLLVLDSWRSDMFTPELTPRLHAFSGGARRFEDHISTGNDTRFGLFSMLYGLHGSYWFKVLEREDGGPCPPELVAAVQREGYDVRVFSAASMNFPALRPTVWSSLSDDQVVDGFTDEQGRPRTKIPWQKDLLVAEAVEGWLDERRNAGEQRPFFAFVLLDGAHQPYFNPGGPYQPSVERINYLELGWTTEGPEAAELAQKVRNTYKNCVARTDRTAGRILQSLGRAGVLDDTVVLVTGDHGEEFGENGFWGHTSNFSPEQLRVPFYLKGPGVVPGVETRPTSHLDVSSSLLELLGADPAARRDYSLGESLLDPPASRARVVAGWAHLGIWTEEEILHLPLERGAEEVAVYDFDWQPLDRVAERCRAWEPLLVRTAGECVRFLRR